MKKIIIAALTMLTLGATQAEYTLKIPLEQAQGGSLPNSSIKFNKASDSPASSTPKECLFQPNGVGLPPYIVSILEFEDNVMVDILWEDLYLSGINTKYIDSDGYRYTPGELMILDESQENAKIYSYQACREPIQ